MINAHFIDYWDGDEPVRTELYVGTAEGAKAHGERNKGSHDATVTLATEHDVLPIARVVIDTDEIIDDAHGG